MRWVELRDVISSVNLLALRLAIRNRELASSYISSCLRHFDELAGRGLTDKNPVRYIYEENNGKFSLDDRVVMPARLDDDSGTRFDEMLILACATRALQPAKIFEIGTYNGRTTSIFILNAPPQAVIYTLDLPPHASGEGLQCEDYIETDIALIQGRRDTNFIQELKLTDRCRQIYCDSMEFDPTPYRGAIDLGFIDGAHALPYVKNDTEKMALMLSDRGLIFWHDYGGKGRFRPLADYLEKLAERSPVYRIAGTTLAWAPGSSIKHLMT